MRRGTGEKVSSPDGTHSHASEDDPTGKRKHERRVLRAFASPQQTRCTFLFVFVTLICTYLIILGSERFGAQVTSMEGVLAQTLDQADGDGTVGKVASAGITATTKMMVRKKTSRLISPSTGSWKTNSRKGPVSRGLATSRRWLDIFKSYKNPRLETPYGNLRVFVYDHLRLPESDRQERLVGEKLDQSSETGGLIAELIRKSNVYTGFAQLADYYLVPVPDLSRNEDRSKGQEDSFSPFGAFFKNLSTKFPFWNRTGGRDHIFLMSESSLTLAQVILDAQSYKMHSEKLLFFALVSCNVFPFKDLKDAVLLLSKSAVLSLWSFLKAFNGNLNPSSTISELALGLQDDDLLRIRNSVFLLPPVPQSESRFDTWKDIVVPPSNGGSSDKSAARQRSIFEIAPTRPHLLFFETTANNTDVGSPLIQRLSESPHLPDALLPSDPLTCHGSCALQRMFESKFCLCTGREFNRLFFGAIRDGCIPVLLGHAPELPFEAFIDYAEFTVKVEADVSREGLIDTLTTVAKRALDQKQAAVAAAAHSFRYETDRWVENGAFDLVLRELERWKRFFRNSSNRFWTKALPLG